MKNRSLLIFALAGVLMVLVMGVALFVTLVGMADREKYAANTQWQVSVNTAESINVTDMNGDGQRDIFVRDAGRIQILDLQGNVQSERLFPERLTSTEGDVTGDGIPDILAYTWAGGASLTLFTGSGETLWERNVAELGRPGRAVAVDFENDGVSEFVVGDEQGQLIAFSAQGERLWTYNEWVGTLRGLDEITTPQGELIVAGLEEGPVVALNRGVVQWQFEADGGLRRLRSFPLGDPVNGRVFVGSTGGNIYVLDGPTANILWQDFVGQAVNEIRPAELDGDPATAELLLGGKDGGLWAYNQGGQQLWRASLGDKVNELASLTDDAFETPLAIAGDDSGAIALYDDQGRRVDSFSAGSSVTRIDVGKLGDEPGFLVAGGGQMRLMIVTRETAPFWYTPLLGGLIACIVIAAAAALLSTLKPAPTLQVSAQEMSVEAQRARRRMLHESIHDLKRMEESGQVGAQAYLARMKQLRGQLAAANEALLKLGEPVQPETFTCPHCNGTLELGADRCEYCGQIVIV